MEAVHAGAGLGKDRLTNAAAGAAIHAATVLFQLTIEGKGDRQEQSRLLGMNVSQHQDAIAKMALNILGQVCGATPPPIPPVPVRGIPQDLLDIVQGDHIDLLDKAG